MAEDLNRRDFLKLAGAGTLALVATKFKLLPTETDLDGTEVETPIETVNTTFIPMYELHTQRPCYAQLLSDKKITPDIHFVEFLNGKATAKEFQESTPLNDIIFADSTSESGKISYGTFLDAVSIAIFAKQDIKVAYEGILLPNFNGKNLLKSNFSISKELFGETLANSTSLKENLSRAFKQLLNLDKDSVILELRNLVIARKLQTLGNAVDTKSGRKALVSFALGKKHENVSELLTNGEKSTLAGFELFSTEALRDIVDVNGGINAFCTTLVLPMGKILIDKKDTKQLVVDTQLQTYLQKRLDRKSV